MASTEQEHGEKLRILIVPFFATSHIEPFTDLAVRARLRLLAVVLRRPRALGFRLQGGWQARRCNPTPCMTSTTYSQVSPSPLLPLPLPSYSSTDAPSLDGYTCTARCSRPSPASSRRRLQHPGALTPWKTIVFMLHTPVENHSFSPPHGHEMPSLSLLYYYQAIWLCGPDAQKLEVS